MRGNELRLESKGRAEASWSKMFRKRGLGKTLDWEWGGARGGGGLEKSLKNKKVTKDFRKYKTS